jgi:hypothetical protein
METENNNKNVLFVGAKIYGISRYNCIQVIVTIERVTKTQAIGKDGHFRFKINVSEFGTVKRISDSSYYLWDYYLETPELKEQFWRQQTILKLQKTDYNKLSVENLKKILSIIEGTK